MLKLNPESSQQKMYHSLLSNLTPVKLCQPHSIACNWNLIIGHALDLSLQLCNCWKRKQSEPSDLDSMLGIILSFVILSDLCLTDQSVQTLL
jgi:hypothetical protein